MSRGWRVLIALALMALTGVLVGIGVVEGAGLLWHVGFHGFDLLLIIAVCGYAVCYIAMSLILRLNNVLKNVGK
jgi:hypothetical protein